jgi:CPA2 family monovalent cation:H+ antiporter-2
MQHLPDLIRDLGLILIVAGITSLLFKKLKQPVVLGYILAGLLVGPNFHVLPSVSDAADIRIWADIGVIFLLFNLGLEFSFKKLIHIGGPAAITALVEVSAMLVIGFGIGRLMGWSVMDSIFLGGILSISSTTIILRAFDELGVKTKRFAQLVFGVLIIEDLVAVVLLVLLSTIAVSREFAGAQMLGSVLKLAFFLLLWFVGGIFFIPTMLRTLKKYLNDETMLILSIGLCLLMVLLASAAGFSPALGAFIMGSILAETTQAERIEHIIKPVKDLFGAVFFVSVGMLIEPKVLFVYALPILLITVLFVFFKSLHVTVGGVIAGQPLKTSVYAGMSQAQIGEFSFIIAQLGVSLHVTGDFLYPIAVAVSAITTFTTPFMIKGAGPLYGWLDRILPVRWKKTLTRYSTGAQTITAASDWQQLLRAFVLHIFLFSLIILGIIFLFSSYVSPLVQKQLPEMIGNCVTALLCVLAIAPFLWALVTRNIKPEAVANIWGNKRYRGPLIFLRIIRTTLAILYIGIFLLSFFPFYIALAGLLILVTVALVFSRKLQVFYVRLEDRFFRNFNDREVQEDRKNRRELAPWDAHVTRFAIPVGTPVIGKTLEEIGLREKFGINIAMIKRGELFTISAPSRYERLYPGDTVFVIGTDEQLEQFRKFIEPANGDTNGLGPDTEIVLKKIKVHRTSFMYGKSIRESGIRERTNGLVVGIERNSRRILNPESNLILDVDDLLWVVGDARLIAEIKAAL